MFLMVPLIAAELMQTSARSNHLNYPKALNVLLLFSATLCSLRDLRDRLFLGCNSAYGQCAEAPMKGLIAEAAEEAEARRGRSAICSMSVGHSEPMLLERPAPGRVLP